MFVFAQAPLPAPALIPKPNLLVMDQGFFHLTAGTRIAYSPETAGDAKMLRSYLEPATGFELPLSRRGGSGAINLGIDRSMTSLGPEAYRLEVKSDRIEIWASQPAGVFYGIETLRQIFPAEILRPSPIYDEAWAAPCLHIVDGPRFTWRGAHMDVSRHFEPKSYVEKFLDEMAFHKLNVFHWHLVDDQGWRIEIKQYPRLTGVSSGGDFSTMNPKGATRSKSVLPGGFYTQNEIREVVKYAAERFITIVPEIEMPGHSLASIQAYPELGNRLEIAQGGGDPKVADFDNVYNVDDSTIHFLQNVLTEVMALFPSKFIHVGGDEVEKRPWKENPTAQARMQALGLKNEEELQSWFISQMDTFLTSKGHRLIGWDEILEGGLAPGAAVMSWRGIDGGIAAAKSGHDVVMAPGSHTYLDHAQSKDRKSEPVSIGGYLPIQTVYEYDPVPPGLTADEAKHVLGAQGQLWSEFIPGPRHMDYMAYPRLCALSEVLWSQPEGRSYSEFLTRLLPHLERLKIQDVFFRPMRPDDMKPTAP
jgi:hexosaminidase